MMATNNAINNSVLITTFNSSGTWTKNSRTQYVRVYGWGGGSGGGSGRRATSTTAGGGAGGTGGMAITCEGPAIFFNTTQTVTIGAGGAGGAAQTTNSTDGHTGAVGSTSAFGSVIRATVATSPTAAGTNGTAAGQFGGGFLFYILTNTLGGGDSGGDGNLTAGVTPTAIFTGYGSTSGGGGGGADSVTPRLGGAGGSFTSSDSSFTVLAGGTAGDPSGTINGGNGNAQASSLGVTSGAIPTGGTGGGGGGGQSGGASAGTGGNGGFPGGGGGGGGGSLNGTASGTGGNGANGFIIVVEFF